MPSIDHSLVSEIRERFCNVDKCPISGERVFFENAGGALTLRSALETSTKFAAIPDNQGRDNLASHTLNNTIKNAKNTIIVLFLSFLVRVIHIEVPVTELLSDLKKY